MENLNTEIKGKILEFLKTKRIGASSSEIAKNIGHNRVTVSKYLEIMKAHKFLDYEGVAQAKLWHICRKTDKPTILIVDDEPHVVDLVALCLLPEKYNIIKTYSGLDALDKVYKETPDLIILDLMMPGINGYEICQKLKENALTQHIPIIILSAKGQLDDKLRGLKIGADDYITKPFDPMELEARVERLIRRTSRDMDTHPLTRLPGREGIRNRIRELLLAKKDFTVFNLTIDHLSDFNRRFGFKRGENLITMLSRMLADLAGDEESLFIGHTLKDRFVLISSNPRLAGSISKAFSNILPYFYRDKKSANMLSLDIKRVSSREIKNKHLKIDEIFSRLGVI